jgi:hypothetical protein
VADHTAATFSTETKFAKTLLRVRSNAVLYGAYLEHLVSHSANGVILGDSEISQHVVVSNVRGQRISVLINSPEDNDNKNETEGKARSVDNCKHEYLLEAYSLYLPFKLGHIRMACSNCTNTTANRQTRSNIPSQLIILKQELTEFVLNMLKTLVEIESVGRHG